LNRQDFQLFCQYDADMNSTSRGKGWGKADSKQDLNQDIMALFGKGEKILPPPLHFF
jgi:hypothetical protein